MLQNLVFSVSFCAGSLDVKDFPRCVHASIIAPMRANIVNVIEKGQRRAFEQVTTGFGKMSTGCCKCLVPWKIGRFCIGHILCLRTLRETGAFCPYSPFSSEVDVTVQLFDVNALLQALVKTATIRSVSMKEGLSFLQNSRSYGVFTPSISLYLLLMSISLIKRTAVSFYMLLATCKTIFIAVQTVAKTFMGVKSS